MRKSGNIHKTNKICVFSFVSEFTEIRSTKQNVRNFQKINAHEHLLSVHILNIKFQRLTQSSKDGSKWFGTKE